MLSGIHESVSKTAVNVDINQTYPHQLGAFFQGVVVVNLTFSICERFSCAILPIYRNRMAANGVNVFINFFLLYILMLSKVVFFFFKTLPRKRSCFFVFNLIQTLMAYFPEIQGGNDRMKTFWCAQTLHPYGLVLWVIIQPYSFFHSCSCFSPLVLYPNLLFLQLFYA